MMSGSIAGWYAWVMLRIENTREMFVTSGWGFLFYLRSNIVIDTQKEYWTHKQ
jgi:hypothetical protein